MKLSTTEKAVVIGVSLVGVGVAASAALIEYLDIPTTASSDSAEKKENDFEIKIPASKEELLKTCADGYTVVKQPLSKVIRIVGQMLVAPIALKVIDAAYNAYSERSNSSSSEAEELAAELKLKNDVIKAIAQPE